jgi:hypothetical protein
VTKAQLLDKLDCQRANCRHYHRCTVYWGRRCSRQGGKKIPRLRMREYNDIDLTGYADVITAKF